MEENGPFWPFIRGRDVAFWATDPREDPCVAPRPTLVQSQSDPADGLLCLTHAPDPNLGSNPSNQRSTRRLDRILTAVKRV